MKLDVDKIYGYKLGKKTLCESQSEFYKMMLSQIKIFSDGDVEKAAFATMGLRILLSDYLILVLQGKMKPIFLSEEFIKKEKDGFRSLMNLENMLLQKAGVPLKENNGKVEIDFETFSKLVGEEWEDWK